MNTASRRWEKAQVYDETIHVKGSTANIGK